jgi:mRNA interferase RelE/StbE
MSFTVKISRPAEKFLRALTDKRLYRRLRDRLDALGEDPRPMNSIKLQGIVYQIQDNQLIVLIVQVGHRREINR